MDVAMVVRESRRRAGLSQAALARCVGTSQAAVSALERGLEHPRAERLDRILQATGHRLVVEQVSGDDVDPDDLELLRRNLQLTPAERLGQVTNRMRLRGLARR